MVQRYGNRHQNADLPLSRLYYWTGRIMLYGNSEASFLLCVPLCSGDGTVFGVCGVEVSQRMFKQLYSPKDSNYEYVFAMTAPSDPHQLQASRGMIAGNYYLTGYRMTEDLNCSSQKNGFYRFTGNEAAYGGLTDAIKLYPVGSPYAGQQWSVAVLMPEALLEVAIKGDSAYLILIVLVLLLGSLTASVVISRRYLHPVTRALTSIQNKTYDGSVDTPYLEINDLFVFLADKDSEHAEELRRVEEQRRGAESKYHHAHKELTRIADQKRREIDGDSYELFLTKLETLTRKEREIFDLYLEGKTAKEIVIQLEFSENALKYHNKNIYSKLGVASRKTLLLYAALMKQDEQSPSP